jgi:vancomycin resistance protein YoaR
MVTHRTGLAMLAAGAVLLLAGALGIRAYGLSPAVPDGFSAGGVPLTGMTLEDAREELHSRAGAMQKTLIRFDSDREAAAGRSAAFAQAGLQWDISAAEATLLQLETGSAFRRAWRRFQLRGTDVPTVLRVDEETFRHYAETAWTTLHSAKPVPAKRVIDSQDRVHVVPDVPAYRVDTEKLRSLMLQVEWDRMWRDAKTPGDGTSGFPEVHVPLSLIEVRAEDTYERVTAQGIERKIVEFSTAIAPGGAGRLHNVTAAAQALNDRLLAPGEVFDYAPVVKEAETRFGFQEAPVIFNGKLTPGIGGGICQVSSTLYNAVLRAGLEIVERRNHSLPVSYAPLGQDATFSEGNIGFRFRNSSGAYLLVRTTVSDNRLTVKLFGRMPAGIIYEIESQTLEELPAPVKTVVQPGWKAGRQEVLQPGKPGYVVDTYRIKKENGAVQSRERISRDRYLPQPSLVAVGGKPSDNGSPAGPDAPDVLEDGVGSPRFR